MLTRLLLIISLLSVASIASSQSFYQELQPRPTINDRIKINLSIGDTSLVRDLLSQCFNLRQPIQSQQLPPLPGGLIANLLHRGASDQGQSVTSLSSSW